LQALSNGVWEYIYTRVPLILRYWATKPAVCMHQWAVCVRNKDCRSWGLNNNNGRACSGVRDDIQVYSHILACKLHAVLYTEAPVMSKRAHLHSLLWDGTATCYSRTDTKLNSLKDQLTSVPRPSSYGSAVLLFRHPVNLHYS